MKTPLATPIATSVAGIAAALALITCPTPGAAAPARPAVQHPQTAALGATIVVGAVRITPVKLIEDSRCPAGTQCVWAGRVMVRVTISSLTAKITRAMTLGQPVSIGGHDVTLIAVTPAKTGAATKPAAYRFRFAVQPAATHA